MKRKSLWSLPLAALMLAGTAAADNKGTMYEIKVTNLTKGQTFTPILAAIHGPDVKLFMLGMPASDELEILAEQGDTAPLMGALLALGDEAVHDVVTAPGLLGPGMTRTLHVMGRGKSNRLSIAAMLIPTNDTFFALNGVSLPRRRPLAYASPGYDAGTEENDQNCSHIPGPMCMGEGSSSPAAGDEGFVGVSNGFHDLGMEDEFGNEILDPFIYDWRNPVVHVTVERLR